MKGRKIKSERIAKTCGAALAVSLVVANASCAVCEVDASAAAGRGIQSSINVNQQAALTLTPTPTPSVTPLLKISPTPTVTPAPAAPAATPVPAAPEPTQAPAVPEAPTMPDLPAAPENPAPEYSDVPETSPAQVPEYSEGSETVPAETPAGSETAPEASGTPVPESTAVPGTSEAPGSDFTASPEAAGTTGDETQDPGASETPGDEYQTEQTQPGDDAQPDGDTVSGIQTSGDTSAEDPGTEENDLPDVSFAGSEELVGFTTFVAETKNAAKNPGTAAASIELAIAGSSPLVGGEIADSVYGSDSAQSTAKPRTTISPTATPATDWSTEMVGDLSSGDEENIPSLGVPSDEGDRGSDEEQVPSGTSRFGVLTGDTTDIFSYVVMGLSSMVVAILTFVTMCARGAKRPEKDRPEQ